MDHKKGKNTIWQRFLLVDGKTNEIVASVIIGVARQILYDDPPELRKGVRLILTAFYCDVIGIAFALTGYFIQPLFRVLMPWASIMFAFGFILTYVGWWLEKSAKKLGASDKKKKRHLHNGYVPSVGPWLDPYGIARDAADVPGKKTYYIVDGEKNAIVDVKRLGKWGQRYVAWRGKRQKQKTE